MRNRPEMWLRLLLQQPQFPVEVTAKSPAGHTANVLPPFIVEIHRQVEVSERREELQQRVEKLVKPVPTRNTTNFARSMLV